MSADLDPDLALVRKLHLELNGSGRRTRGPALPPVKKVKCEGSRPLEEALKDSSSISISGSGSGSGKMPKREGTLRRLIKKQPNSDSNQDTMAGQSSASKLEQPATVACGLSCASMLLLQVILALI